MRHFQLYTIYLAIAVGNRPFRQIDPIGSQCSGYVYISNGKKMNLALLTEGAKNCVCATGFQFAPQWEGAAAWATEGLLPSW